MHVMLQIYNEKKQFVRKKIISGVRFLACTSTFRMLHGPYNISGARFPARAIAPLKNIFEKCITFSRLPD
jgi:hypothetical protein